MTRFEAQKRAIVTSVGAAVLPLALACGGTARTSDGAGGGGNGNAGARGDGGGAGTGAGNAGAAASTNTGPITGTWEVMGTQYSRHPTSLVVTISPTALTFTGSGSSFTAIAHGETFSVTYSSGYLRVFNATRTAAPGSAGIVPLPLFGTWSLKNDKGNGCDGTIGSNAMSGKCEESLSQWPLWLPSIGYGQFTAKRTKQLVSDFGDFGGEWTVTTSRDASCTARFENGTMSSVCTNALKANGTASMTFDGDNAYGTTNAGIEFSAQRR